MMGDPVPVHRTILALDVEGSTRPERRDRDRLEMRAVLYRLLGQALSRAGIQRGDYQRTDQGDGVLVLLNSEVPKTRVLPWMILRLAAGLERHNQTAPAPRQLRLRVVVHAGEVASDAHGYVGKDLNLAFRLLDSESLRSQLAGTRTSLVLLISNLIYNDIVEQGYGDIAPDAFQPIHVLGKNVDAQAWVYLPGRHNAGPADGRSAPGPGARTAAPMVPRELPVDILNFTGREVELKWLLATLHQAGRAATTVVAIHGVGGVGKPTPRQRSTCTRPLTCQDTGLSSLPEAREGQGGRTLAPWRACRFCASGACRRPPRTARWPVSPDHRGSGGVKHDGRFSGEVSLQPRA